MNDINIILADLPGLGRIRICECNSIHVSIGPVTINLTPEAFAQAVTLMRDAMDQFAEISGSNGEPNRLGTKTSPASQLTH